MKTNNPPTSPLAADLGYTLPAVQPALAAARAVRVLEDVAKDNGAGLVYIIQPSNLLALAGLRAESPYNVFRPRFGQDQQDRLEATLRRHGLHILYQRDPYIKDKRTIFSLINSQALADIPLTYAITKPFWQQPVAYDYINMSAWSMYVESQFCRMMEDNFLPHRWLRDWWSPHNIRFGILLGYPGTAITSFCELSASGKDADLAEVELPFQGLYEGTHVTYGLSKSLVDDPVIRAHAALWSDVITQIYQVFTPKRLRNDVPGFWQEYQRYSAYERRR